MFRGFLCCGRARIAAVSLLLIHLASGAAQAETISTDINDYVAEQMDDFTANIKVVQYDERAGLKISDGFGYAYALKGDVLLRYKDENKLRLDGFLGASKATYIINGTKQYARIPGVNINTTMELGKSPGKRKTLLDVGLISKGYLAYTEAQYVGNRPVDGVMCAVFRVSYRDKTLDTSHRMIWLDPKSRVTLKREEYSQVGKLNSIIYYKNPKEVAPGIWFPTTIEVYNNEGQKAGVTAYRNIKVNQNLPDSVFK
jgi:outer membrane lipoprotein-sorting protein